MHPTTLYVLANVQTDNNVPHISADSTRHIMKNNYYLSVIYNFIRDGMIRVYLQH